MAGRGLHLCFASGLPTPPLRTFTRGLQSLTPIPLETIQRGERSANPFRASISVGLISRLLAHLEGSRLPSTILAARPFISSPYAVQRIIQLVDFVSIPPLALRSSLNVKELKAASIPSAVGQESILSRASGFSVCYLLGTSEELGCQQSKKGYAG